MSKFFTRKDVFVSDSSSANKFAVSGISLNSSNADSKTQFFVMKTYKYIIVQIQLNAVDGHVDKRELNVVLGQKFGNLPEATHDTLSFAGWYTAEEGGVKITSDTIVTSDIHVLYAHFTSKSYTVSLNNQWFLDNRSGKDPNGKAYGTTYSTNPDANTYDGTYISYSNFNVNSGQAKMRINFVGYNEFVVYIRSYAESNYDYTLAGKIDQNVTTSVYQAYTRGSQTSGTSISNYKKVTYSNLDGKQHFIEILFRKDGSVNSNQDRGYVLIPKIKLQVPITISFETNGGSAIEPIQMMSGNKITKPSDPTKADWYFSGWYSDSDLTQSWNFNTVVYEDMTLYAKWRDTALPYDSEIEYLESTGTQFIEIPFLPNQDSGYEIDFQVIDWNQSSPFFARWTFNPTYDSFGIGFTSGYAFALMYGRYSSNHYFLYGSISDKLNRYVVKQYNKKIYVNDSLTVTFTNSVQSNVTPYLFGNHSEEQGNSKCICKIWSFKYFQENEIKMNLIPVRKDGVGYMYDKVSGQLFGNSGTGSFILGPDK